MTFGEKLQALRKAQGLSQEQLAAQMTVSRQAVSKWELDESNPDIENILQLSNIFGVSTDYLLKEDAVLEGAQGRRAEKQQAKDSRKGQIFFILSVSLFAIGLLGAWSDWHERQTMIAIAAGMIMQVAGAVCYCLGRLYSRGKPPFAVDFANLALGLFMPVSMLATLVFRGLAAPYPTDFRAAIAVIPVYLVVMGICYIILKRRVGAKKA